MPDLEQAAIAARTYVPLLSFLLVCFVGRVVAQIVQGLSPVSGLPPFEQWQSGALPYPLLLASQLLIIVVAAGVIGRLRRGLLRPSRPTGLVLLVLGLIYAAVMAGRLVIGLTLAPDHYWFAARLPTVFHLVLAAFLLVCAHFHLRQTGRTQHWRQGERL